MTMRQTGSNIEATITMLTPDAGAPSLLSALRNPGLPCLKYW